VRSKAQLIAIVGESKMRNLVIRVSKKPLWRLPMSCTRLSLLFLGLRQKLLLSIAALTVRLHRWQWADLGSPILAALRVASNVLLFGIRLPQPWDVLIDQPLTRNTDRRIMGRRSESSNMQSRISMIIHFVRVDLYVIDRRRSQTPSNGSSFVFSSRPWSPLLAPNRYQKLYATHLINLHLCNNDRARRQSQRRAS
jgi:hypothetical protein